MITQQQKNIKKMIDELNLKYDTTICSSIYIEKNRKIKDIQDLLFYLLYYDIIRTGEYIRVGDYISLYRHGIKDIHYNYNTGRIKIELYKEE
jgi:hypothetical protein